MLIISLFLIFSSIILITCLILIKFEYFNFRLLTTLISLDLAFNVICFLVCSVVFIDDFKNTHLIFNEAMYLIVIKSASFIFYDFSLMFIINMNDSTRVSLMLGTFLLFFGLSVIYFNYLPIFIILVLGFISLFVFFKRNRNISSKTYLSVIHILLIVALFFLLGTTVSSRIIIGGIEDDAESGFGAAANTLGIIISSVLEHPIHATIIVFMIVGYLPGMIPVNNPGFEWVSSILTSWVPMMIWIMVGMGTIEVPDDLIIILGNHYWFARIFYWIFVGSIYLIVNVGCGAFSQVPKLLKKFS